MGYNLGCNHCGAARASQCYCTFRHLMDEAERAARFREFWKGIDERVRRAFGKPGARWPQRFV